MVIFVRAGFLTFCALLLAAGCAAPSPSKKAGGRPAGSDRVACYTHYYLGELGDGHKEWTGCFYLKQNLSIVAHLPTRSEFYIRVFKAVPHEPGVTNGIMVVLDRLMNLAQADSVTNSWQTLTQKVGRAGKSKGPMRSEDFSYLRAEFVGQRFDTDSYSKNDQVKTTAFITYLSSNAPPEVRERSLYFTAAAMIPTDVSSTDQDRLINVLIAFLQGVHLYQD